jgi:hypothetical protein
MKAAKIAVTVTLGLGLLWIGCGPKVVRGRVVDSVSGKGIGGVTVRSAERGWGISNGSLVLDKDYVNTTRTDATGYFTLQYRGGGTSVHLQFSKEGYHATKAGYPLQDTYIDFWEQPNIRLEENRP